MWGQLYHEAARGALAKLDNVLPDEQRHEVSWARRTLLATHMHRGDQTPLLPQLEKLRRAARERRRVAMTYRSRSHPEPLEREVDPYALVHRWGWWYLVGYCRLREAVRTFRVDRIIKLILLNETFELLPDFDVRSYLAAEPQHQPRIQVCLRFAPDSALIAIDDRAFWDELSEQADGSVVVSFATPSLEWAARVALGYGPQVTVLEPEELRCMIGEQARVLAARYICDERRE
jgi:predicted DNA-binding transcriptional regulator YafY